MTQHSQNGEGVDAVALDWVLSGGVRDLPPMPDTLSGYGCDGCPFATLNPCNTEEDVCNDRAEAYFDCALLPAVKVWGEEPICTIAQWQQRAREEVARLRSLAREPATADVGRDTVAFVQQWLMSGDHEPTKWERDFAAAIDARVIAASAADLAEHFCVTPLPDDVCADLCATVQGPGRYGTHLLTVDQATRVLSAALSRADPSSGHAMAEGEL